MKSPRNVVTRSSQAAVGCVLLALSLGGIGCGAEGSDADPAGTDLQTQPGDLGIDLWWKLERARRTAALSGYVLANVHDFQSFKNAPMGSSGIPMVMFRLFPELFPDIWGTPDQHFAPVGLAQDPYEPWRALPLGMGFSKSEPAITTPLGPVNIQVAAPTCVSCHMGRVAGPDGKIQTVIGAPNGQFNAFRRAVGRTVADPRYSAETFVNAINSKPLGWVYQDPSQLLQEYAERQIFLNGCTFTNGQLAAGCAARQFLGKLQAGAQASAQRFVATLGSYTYAVPNPPDPSGSPGVLDAIGAGLALLVDPAKLTPDQLRDILPKAPAQIDIMSVWQQQGRPAAQWDGSIVSAVHRQIASEFGVIGNPAALNMENAVRTTRFTNKLPATPYPFDVQRDKVARGQHLYGEYCASCHSAGNDHLFTPAQIGTDPNRANIWSPYTVQALYQVLNGACTDATCKQADGSPLPLDKVLRATGAYMAVPLDGIWARAPYLHNGSVPTLYHLLAGDRPATFYRGNTSYDQNKVGFAWDRADPYAVLYDTGRAGLSNKGHDTAAFNGDVDWKNQPQLLADLLEYLKTL